MSYILIDKNSSLTPYLNISQSGIGHKFNPLEASFYNQLEYAVKVKDSLANNKTILIKKIIWKIDDCIDLNKKLEQFDQEIINLKQNREKLIKSLSNE